MFYSVISARYVAGYKVEITFEDGAAGVVDFGTYIRRGGVFAKLADVEVFKRFEINPDFGVICWGDVDIAPETLYAAATRGKSRRTQQTPMSVAETGGTYHVEHRKHGPGRERSER